MATHFSTAAWKIPWTEKPGRLQPMTLQSQTTETAECTAVVKLRGSLCGNSQSFQSRTGHTSQFARKVVS